MAVINVRGGVLGTSALDEVSTLTSIVETLPLTDLSDVTVTTPLDDQILAYNVGTSQWENKSLDAIGGGYTDTDAINAIEGATLTLQNQLSTLNSVFVNTDGLSASLPNHPEQGYNLTNAGMLNVKHNSMPLTVIRETTSSNSPQSTDYSVAFYNNTNIADGFGVGHIDAIADTLSFRPIGALRAKAINIGLSAGNYLDTYNSTYEIITYRKSTPGVGAETAFNTATFYRNQTTITGRLAIQSPTTDGSTSHSSILIDYNGSFADAPSGKISVTNQNAATTTELMTFDELAVAALVPFKLVNMDTTTRDALTASSGMVIFNTTTSTAQYYNGSTWIDM